MSSNVEYLPGGTETLCRCKKSASILKARNENFCKECYLRFVRGKQRRQMQDERYKVKYGDLSDKLGKQKVLLPFSGGPSSFVLLDVIASLLSEQYNTHKGMQGFQLLVLHIDESELVPLNKSVESVVKQFFERYSLVSIEFKTISMSSFLKDREMIKAIKIKKDFSAFAFNKDEVISFKDVMNSCPNKSTFEELISIVNYELILKTAHAEKCQTIIYGHSMTRIANEIISLTVNGRGSSIHNIQDREITYNGKDVKIIFPLREVLKSEILAYLRIATLGQFVVESTKVKSSITKNMTIRDLVTQYFTQLDATGYSSTASTVVKTGEKLGPLKSNGGLFECQICSTTYCDDPRKWLQSITVRDPAPLTTDEEKYYSKLYIEYFGDEKDRAETNVPLHVCYGCTVSLMSQDTKSSILWPVKVKNKDREILDEYIIDEE